jgi:RHS repeat-associated protein
MSFYKRSNLFAVVIFFLICISLGKQCFAQTPGTNYVRTRVPQIPVTDTVKLDTIPVQRQMVSILYSDGLGRGMQTIQQQGSPGLKDIVMPYTYDHMGRSINSFLSYADETTTTLTTGQFRDTAVQSVLDFYTPTSPGAVKIPTDISPYAQTVFELSPLGRVVEQGNIGSVFQPGTSHTIKLSYQVNSSNDDINNYIINNGTPSIISQFGSAVLTKTIVTDGNGHRMVLWKDLQGRQVTRTQLDAPTAYYSTDYIYNDLNELVNIITPAGKKQLANFSTSFQNILAQQSYNFHYDSVGRMVEKKVPDKGWEYVIYNHRNEPVLLQDSNMRVKNQWLYLKYDAEGRMVQTGIYTNMTVTTRKAMQYLCDTAFPTLWETWQPGIGYTNNTFPQQSIIPTASPLVIYTTNYYDDYSFIESAAKPFHPNVYNTTPTMRTMGMPTGSSRYVLGTANQYLVTVNYYDSQNRLIQQLGDNHLGQVDEVDNQYNFIGELTGSLSKTIPLAGDTITLKDRYVYDHLERLLSTYESLNGSAEVDISHNVYNEISQKVSEGLHSTNADVTFAQTQEFTYNIRSELTNINNGTLTNDGITQNDPNALFGESITYSETSPLGATPQYNGNISGVTWRNKIEQSGVPGVTTGGQGYAFNYDNVDRLMQSSYYTQTGNTFTLNTTGALTEKINAYDEMGNIDTLQRRDKNGNLLNSLTYNYPSMSNQLQSITDGGAQNISGTFTYDGNGNMTSDSRKGITITYNNLNLPDTVKQGSSKLVFTYDAKGNKLYKQLITSGVIVSQRHYVEDVELTASTSIMYDGKIESIAMAEGRILNPDKSSYQYEYYLQDHLYTNRVSFRPNADGTLNLGLVQNYYPFGGDMGDATMNYSASPQSLYKYEGKELQPELNLNTFDFGARHYDPVLDRWTSIDPLAAEADELSPYNYVENAPINLIDPDGMQPNPNAMPPGTLPEVHIFGGSATGSSIFGSASAGVNGLLQFGMASSYFNIQKSPVTSQSWVGLNKVQQNPNKSNIKQSNTNIEVPGIDNKKAEELDKQYPKKEGKTEGHHVKPKYLGGDKNGPIVDIPAGYHQGITNEFRDEWGYGQGIPTDEEYDEIQKRVYEKYPIPTSPPANNSNGFIQRVKDFTGLSGIGLGIYITISELSRLYPPRNLIPAP